MTDRRVITLPVTLDAANRLKDRSLSIRCTTSLEVPNVEFAVIDQFVGHSGWFGFSEDEIQAVDLPTSNTASDGKSQAKRTRSVLFLAWRQTTDESEDFESYYRRRTEWFIDLVKEELN